MRRKDREMDREFGFEVIDKARYGVLSMVDGEGGPYGIPLSIVRLGDNLYFHSAKEGRKIEMLGKSKRVSVAFVGEVNVPENYTHEELDEITRDPSKAVVLISSVFTTEYEAAIVAGEVKEVSSDEEKTVALEAICKKYVPSMMEYFPLAVEAGMERTSVFKVEIEEVTAKRKKYDSSGQEMKWGRME